MAREHVRQTSLRLGPRPYRLKLGIHVCVVQELPKYLPVAGSPEKLERARLRGNDLCSRLSGLARSARGAQGRPSFGQWEGRAREKLRSTYVLKRCTENFYKC